MEADKFKKGGVVTFEYRGAFVHCYADNRDVIIEHFRHDSEYGHRFRMEEKIPHFINLLDYTERFADTKYLRMFITHLSNKDKITLVCRVISIMQTLMILEHLLVCRIGSYRISYSRGQLFLRNSKGIIRQCDISVRMLRRYARINMIKYINGDCEIDSWVGQLYTNKNNVVGDLARNFDIEKIVSALLPQPIAEEICEYLR